MLTWAAYKLNLLPDSLNPQHITVETVEVDCLDSVSPTAVLVFFTEKFTKMLQG